MLDPFILVIPKGIHYNQKDNSADLILFKRLHKFLDPGIQIYGHGSHKLFSLSIFLPNHNQQFLTIAL